MKKYIVGLFMLSFTLSHSGQAQELGRLSVEKIMRDPKWIGESPSNFRWSADSRHLYFNWNPERKDYAEVYRLDVKTQQYNKASETEAEENSTRPAIYSHDKSYGAFEKSGDIYLYNTKTKTSQALTQTQDREQLLGFLNSGELAYQRGDNVYLIHPQDGRTTQLTNFVRGNKPATAAQRNSSINEHYNWLKKDQMELFDVLKDNDKQKKLRDSLNNVNQKEERKLKPQYYGDDMLSGLRVSPEGRYVGYRLFVRDKESKNTDVPNFVTESGYIEDLVSRPKVGTQVYYSKGFIYDAERDTIIELKVEQIPGIKDLPDYLTDYPERLAERQKTNENRSVNWGSISWNADGRYAVVTAKAIDNKDFWILRVDPSTGDLSLIDRQRDEAWIAGPGIGRDITWIDANSFYFQSEKSGYSHLYVHDLNKGQTTALTQGNWEVQRVQLSDDKKSFYIQANKEHPGITHFYKLPVAGGELQQLTTQKGGNEVTLSPDEKWLAINHSNMNTPWELYLQENKNNANAERITHSTTAEFESYAWREPDMVKFQNRHGDDVYARVYPAKNPHPSKPAVVFVHGAGYLQNVHYWWSQYFREYMFNNMLADEGYTVIDIDYTASSGYGRNHRTGIYRHMGGKDLTDQVDGVKYLVDNYGINPENVGIYGGSYGGFITLMALFHEPEVFKSGAALRSVTDWAHYNHGYTANILNTPAEDPLAFKRSSPIYFADKLQGNLLMLHGMVDVNVQFQDIVRLTQRFIELGKDNWDLAVYPVEDHGFVQPSSWTDEYKRIFKLFENTLK